MKAVRIHRFGDADVLRVEEIAWPQPGGEEVLVRVHAASVNPVDYKMRSGRYPATSQENLPLVLGRDIAGTVELCGSGARAFSKGEEVFAMLGRDRGGYEEYVVVKAGEIAPKPMNLSYVEAAAVPLAGLTAWQGLFEHGRLRAGQRVLIHGGAGGVGHFAIQFAKARGAFVATTVSGSDVDFAQDLGADRAIDYKKLRFEDEIDKVDLVFDLIGGETQERSWAILREGGALVSTLRKPDEDKARRFGLRGVHYMAQPNGAQLAEIGRLIEAGRVRPAVQATYPLDKAGEAQRKLETSHVRGKVVLQVVR